MNFREVPLIHAEYCLTTSKDVYGPKQKQIPLGSILSVAMGDVWLYFWFESLVAIRHQTENWSYYVNLEDVKVISPDHHAYSLQFLTQEILDVIARDFGGDEPREIKQVPLSEICFIAMARVFQHGKEHVLQQLNVETKKS